MMEQTTKIVDEIINKQSITQSQLSFLLNDEIDTNHLKEHYLFAKAREICDETYGKNIFIRGLIEFTNYCKNDCYYCGIRRSNREADRYRLTKEDILECCEVGYNLGFRTFVLQGGEDAFFNDDLICEIIKEIRQRYEDCAITLSIGEREKESYRKFYDAGANRYLLRHETADNNHYRILHPEELSLEHRMQCLRDLREIGYQVGCGFMVGSPGQTEETLFKDLMYIKELQPHMVGIGPFIPQHQTPFAEEKAGTLEMTLKLLAIIRLIHPKVLLPSTTALGSIHPQGRELGILAGANVVMPNLSPSSVRKKYSLYDNKISTGDEAAEGVRNLAKSMSAIGYRVVEAKGDSLIT